MIDSLESPKLPSKYTKSTEKTHDSKKDKSSLTKNKLHSKNGKYTF